MAMSSKVFTVAGLTLAKCPDTKRLLRPRKSNSYDHSHEARVFFKEVLGFTPQGVAGSDWAPHI